VSAAFEQVLIDLKTGRIICAMRPEAPRNAMVLAAGLGQRMRPITTHLPKPLVVVGGHTMLDHALDRLAEAGVTHAVVNVHWLADQIEAHVATRTVPQITISDERDQLLETGGGVKKALPLLGREPFLHVNSDSLWVETGHSNILAMGAAWSSHDMDMLLLLAQKDTSYGYEGAGDFTRNSTGQLARRSTHETAPFVYAGVAIIKPELFENTPDGPFSLNLLFDRCIVSGRLHGHVLDGQWLHVGTPEAIPEANKRFASAVGTN
jgi:N-acetyl-alpha-D-muramate 1-phosphate uridylyltransferase